MKKILVFCVLSMTTISFFSCLKKDTTSCPYKETEVKAPATEVDRLKAYLDDKGINALKDSAGFYYNIETAGTGTVTPEVCTNIAVNYTGRLASNDSIFDKTSGTPAVFTLGSLIPGWIKGLKHLKEGGKMRLYLPPSLAYGSAGATRTDPTTGNTVVVIPANAILIFDLEIVAMQ